jgi:hypothetical protein
MKPSPKKPKMTDLAKEVGQALRRAGELPPQKTGT